MRLNALPGAEEDGDWEMPLRGLADAQPETRVETNPGFFYFLAHNSLKSPDSEK
jgi:hypothetical protein